MSGSLVAILMQDEAKAHDLATCVAMRGSRPFIASGIDALYAKSGEETIDVLVIENRLQSFFSGIEIVERLQADHAQPVTVLLGPESLKHAPDVRRLRIFQVDPPSVSVQALAEAVQAASEKARLARPPLCPRAQRLISQVDGIEPLSPLVLKVAASIRDTSICPEALLADIAADPAAVADVLRIVNSSAIGRSQKTSNIQQAIHFLGARRTLSAVLSAGLVRAQERLLVGAPREIRQWYGRRTVLIASVAEAFAKNLEKIQPETAYILGLLQDVGILALSQVYRERYLLLLRRVDEIPHLRLEAEERNQLGTSHADVTAALLRQFKLPDFLAAIARRHHLPLDTSAGNAVDDALVRVMQIGEAVANIADHPSPQRLMTLNYLLARYRQEPGGLCCASLTEAIGRITELSQVLGLPAPEDRVLEELAENVKKHSGYAPEAGFTPYASNPASSQPLPKNPSSAALDGGKKQPRVLVVEDDHAIAKLIHNTLARLGVDIVHAACTRDALAAVSQADAVLCDIHLGDEDGVSAIKQLRATGFTGPVVIISGDGSRATVERVVQARVSEYLLKPFSRAQLVEKLKKYPGIIPDTPASPIPHPVASPDAVQPVALNS